MSVEEIVRALECCGNGKCEKCPKFNDDECVATVRRESISLIRYQGAVIEWLKSQCLIAAEEARLKELNKRAEMLERKINVILEKWWQTEERKHTKQK